MRFCKKKDVKFQIVYKLLIIAVCIFLLIKKIMQEL